MASRTRRRLSCTIVSSSGRAKEFSKTSVKKGKKRRNKKVYRTHTQAYQAAEKLAASIGGHYKIIDYRHGYRIKRVGY